MNSLRKLRALLRKEALDAEMAEELRHHLEARIAEHVAAGMAPDEARRAAQLAFGGLEQIKERCRDERSRGILWLELLARDLRHAAKSFGRSPGFTLVAVAMLALGIGASTACFSFLNAFFLHRPPFADPAGLVTLHTVDERNPGLQRLSFPNFFDYREQNPAFTDLAFHTWTGVRYREGEQNADLFGQLVSGNYFTLLGTPAALGRTLLASDDAEGAPLVVVISHAVWKARFGADPAAIGRTLLINNQPFTLVGVAPEDFRGITLLDTPEFWVPFGTRRVTFAGPGGADVVNSRRAVVVSAFGRLKPGVTLAQAEAALRPVAKRLADDFPADNGGRSLRFIPINEALLDPNARADMVRAGNLLMALSGLLLLIACGNLANLLLARAGTRQREIALRVALGASRGQIVRQLLTEHFLLALAGGLLGVMLAHWLRDLLWALRPRGFAENFAVPMDGGVLAFAMGATLFTGLLFGLVPALSGSRLDLVAVLKRATRGGGVPLFSIRNVLVAAQVSLSVVALVIAGLFLRSLQRANTVNLGWNARGLVLLAAGLGREGYDVRRALDYYERALARLRSVPGVLDASLSTRPFLTGENPQRTIRPQGADETLRTRGQFMSYASVMPGYLSLMGIELVAGRDIAPQDDDTRPPVVVINEALARRAWPGEDAVGKKVKLYSSETEVEVIGVVRNIRDVELKAAPAPFLFFSLRQPFTLSGLGNVFHIRVAGDAAAVTPALRKELQSIDPAVNIFVARTYDELIRHALWGQRTGAALMTAFGGLALLLTALGIYGVTAHAVGQRTREIGIRLAIGAQASAVLGLVLRRGLVVAGAGLAVGLGIAFGVTRYVRNMLYEVEATDPLTFAAIAGGLGFVALIACYIPARRAAKVDPMVAVRAE